VMFACLCCGSLTLSEEPPGTHAICPVCFWEDDPEQGRNPDAIGGANTTTLAEARRNYETFGASERRFVDNVRQPSVAETPPLQP
jgi:hypothetical protein